MQAWCTRVCYAQPQDNTSCIIIRPFSLWQVVYSNDFNDGEEWFRGKVLSMSDCGRAWVKFDTEGDKYLMNLNRLELAKVRTLVKILPVAIQSSPPLISTS